MKIVLSCFPNMTNIGPRFVLKTKEQRRAEKALMDKSPLNTLTLEDFLESERHKLSGTLTPVTPDSFAKWKKERLDKKAAEAQALKAKEATGRAMFESGNWKDSGDEDSEEDESEDDDSEQGAWNLESMRQETERIRAKKEVERLAKLNGRIPPDPDQDNENRDSGSQPEENDDDDNDNDNDNGGEGSSGGRP